MRERGRETKRQRDRETETERNSEREREGREKNRQRKRESILQMQMCAFMPTYPRGEKSGNALSLVFMAVGRRAHVLSSKVTFPCISAHL